VAITVSGHELLEEHDCSTVACTDPGTIRLGSLWYCRHHAGPVPKDAARTPARTRNGTTPTERRRLARELHEQGLTRQAIASELNVSLSSVGNYLNGGKPAEPEPAVRADGPSLEFRAAALVELGRKVDEARARFEPARLEFEEACRRWDEGVARLPASLPTVE
jgi:transcriptional regulator with XRE-family HTH domain